MAVLDHHGVEYLISKIANKFANIKESENIGTGAYTEVHHGNADIDYILTPNTFHVWDEVVWDLICWV